MAQGARRWETHGTTRRRFAAILGAVAAAPVWLAACGSSAGTNSASSGGSGGVAPSSPGGAAPAPAKKRVTVRITARLVPEQDMWPIRVPAFHEKYPNVTVETDLHEGNIQEKIAALIASGEIGDVVHTHPSAAQPQTLFLAGAMQALDKLVARDKVDLKGWYAQAIEAGRLDGKLISLPFKGKMATVALFYNQTLFDQAGLKPPDLNTSLDELTEMAIKLTKPDGSQWGIAAGQGALPGSSRSLTGTIRRWNAELFSKDQKKATLDTQEAQAAFAWHYDAFHKRKFIDPTADASKLFQQGKAAMLIYQDYNEKTKIQPASEAQGFKYSATIIPKGPTSRRGGVWIPDALQLSSTTKNADEAWLALQWFADHDTGLALAQQKSQGTSTTPGARPDVYGDPKFLNHDVFPKLLQELDRDSNVLGENYQGIIPANYKLADINKVLGGAATKIKKNEAEPTPSFLKALNQELQNILDLPR